MLPRGLVGAHHHRPGPQYAWFDSSEPGDPSEKGTAALTFSRRFKWDIAHRTKLTLEYAGNTCFDGLQPNS